MWPAAGAFGSGRRAPSAPAGGRRDRWRLLNQTAADNHALQVQSVGVESERDAIGARIRIEVGNRQSTDWVIGGDGYLCRNEAVVSFGLGDASTVDQIEIEWPSGVSQKLVHVAADRRILIVENESAPFTLHAFGQ